MIEVTEAERRERASKLFTDVPALWVFSFVELLADEIGRDRDELLTLVLRMYHDRLEAKK